MLARSIPVQFEIEGARSEMMVELAGAQAELKDHRIPLEKGRDRGWGRVSIPADANPADNDFWFVFEQPAPRRSVVVAEDAPAARPLELAAAISPDPLVKCTAEVVAASQLAAVDWDGVSLLLWQAPLPDAQTSKQVQAFVDRGGSVIFFPAHVPGTGDLFGVRWTAWESPKSETAVESWRGDEDLLAHTASGQPLPVGQLQVRKYCGLSGEVTPLATLRGGAPLLARVTTTRGSAYFCATTPAPADSSLASSGVVFYVLIQRALASGAAALGNTRQLTAGDAPADNPTLWKRVAGAREAISTDYAFHRGVYQDGERLLAVNRAAAEASAPVLGGPAGCGPVPGPRLCPGRRQGGQSGFVDPGNLAAVPGGDDGGDGGRGRPLLAQGRASGGSCFMSVSRSLTFLGTPWSVAASLLAVAFTAAFCFIAWRRSGYRPSMGLLEFMRLALVATVAVLLNQPEWIEEFRPEEKPAIAVLWDASASMDTRDVVPADQPTATPVTRHEAIAGLADPASWNKLRERMNVVIQAVAEPRAGARHRPERAARPHFREGRQPAGHRAGLRRRLERGPAAGRGGHPPADARGADPGRAGGQPHAAARYRAVESGCAHVRHLGQGGPHPVFDR